MLQEELPTDATVCTMSLFPFSRHFRTCFLPSWVHHQGYFKLLFLCYQVAHAVLCWSSACVSGLFCVGDFGSITKRLS